MTKSVVLAGCTPAESAAIWRIVRAHRSAKPEITRAAAVHRIGVARLVELLPAVMMAANCDSLELAAKIATLTGKARARAIAEESRRSNDAHTLRMIRHAGTDVAAHIADTLRVMVPK